MLDLTDIGDEASAFPGKADIVIIGGGIIGCAAAYFMAARGASVVLLEKGRVGAEQSGRNWGWCRQQGRAIAEIPLIQASMGMWELLSAETGRELGFRRSGIAYVTNDPAMLRRWETWLERVRPHALDSQLLSATEAEALMPRGGARWLGGLHTPSDGRAEPGLAAPAIAAAARERGARVFQACAVRGLEIERGKVVGVVSERGRIRAAKVLCAAGAWSSLFCRQHGVALPQLMIRGSVLRTQPAPEVIKGALSTPFFTLRRRLDGGYTLAMKGQGRVDLTADAFRYARAFWPLFRKERKAIKIRLGGESIGRRMGGASPFERTRVLDPAPDQSVLDRALAGLKRAFPALAGIDVAARWAGAIDATPDAIPVIDAVPSLPGLYLATGFSGHGFGIGPGAGHLAADLVLGERPLVDPHPFRYARLVDGAKFEPDAGL